MSSPSPQLCEFCNVEPATAYGGYRGANEWAGYVCDKCFALVASRGFQRWSRLGHPGTTTTRREPVALATNYGGVRGPEVVEALRLESEPLAGRPGWRRDGEGREWYSSAWL